MPQNYGITVPEHHEQTEQREAARYLVVIDSGGSAVARLFLEDRTQVAEFDAGAEEVAMMSNGLLATKTADQPAWDQALAGHSREERAAAEVYTLDV